MWACDTCKAEFGSHAAAMNHRKRKGHPTFTSVGVSKFGKTLPSWFSEVEWTALSCTDCHGFTVTLEQHNRNPEIWVQHHLEKHGNFVSGRIGQAKVDEWGLPLVDSEYE